MKQIIKEQVVAFLKEYNRVCGRQMIVKFGEKDCIISGEDIFSSTFLLMFDEAFPAKPFEFYFGVRGTSIYMCLYKKS